MSVAEARRLLDDMKQQAEAAKAELNQIAAAGGFGPPPPPPGGVWVPLLLQLLVVAAAAAVAWRYYKDEQVAATGCGQSAKAPKRRAKKAD